MLVLSKTTLFLLFLVLVNSRMRCEAHCSCHSQLEPTPCKRRSKMAVTYSDSDILVCSKERCGEVEYAALKWSFQGSFLPMNTAGSQAGSESEFTSDNDLCCETNLYSTHYSGEEKTNVAGELCNILYIPSLDQHQMVTEGVCGHTGACSGVCQQMYTVQPIIAWNNSTENLGPELFEIPTYCACINTDP